MLFCRHCGFTAIPPLTAASGFAAAVARLATAQVVSPLR
jgi:hypothetical protein